MLPPDHEYLRQYDHLIEQGVKHDVVLDHLRHRLGRSRAEGELMLTMRRIENTTAPDAIPDWMMG